MFVIKPLANEMSAEMVKKCPAPDVMSVSKQKYSIFVDIFPRKAANCLMQDAGTRNYLAFFKQFLFKRLIHGDKIDSA